MFRERIEAEMNCFLWHGMLSVLSVILEAMQSTSLIYSTQYLQFPLKSYLVLI
jgi:hypothetical protein